MIAKILNVCSASLVVCVFLYSVFCLSMELFCVMCVLYLIAVPLPPDKTHLQLNNNKKKLHGLNPRANYTDRATAACRRSDCQLLRIEGATWSL
jgi:hypothetical protein